MIPPKNTYRYFADVAIPVPVREDFTYHIDPDISPEDVRPGMRVWVPLRGTMSIGMVVRVHQNKPSFETMPVRKVLDTEPILDGEILRLTEWIHRFYFCSKGEVVQAALPAGMNFNSVTYLQFSGPGGDLKANPSFKNLKPTDFEIIETVKETGNFPLKEAYNRWGVDVKNRIGKLRRRGLIETWEQPEVRVKPKMELYWDWKEGFDPPLSGSDKPNYKWQQGYLFLKKSKLLPAPTAALSAFPELTPYTLNKLADEGILEKTEKEVIAPEPEYEFNPDQISGLNEHQVSAFEHIRTALDANEFETFLLYGVTGSGKTEVYIHALKHAIEQGKGALVLVPEIALTPQTVRRFYKIFGPRIAILHSRLNDRERYDAWKALQSGEKDIAIGARSAIFAPVHNPGIIIIDEEHDTSYRQADPAPRYHAREVAAMRAMYNNAVLVLGSATPSLVSLVASTKGKSKLLKLQARHTGASLPEVRILDMKAYRSAMRGPLAVPLYEAVCEAAAGGEQSILLYNRRGFAGFMQCSDCGQVVECPDCSVTLTYHKKLNQLRCHYCGYSSRADRPCPSCKHPEVVPRGSGTQKVEEELETILPDIRVLRMDQDTTSGKHAHETILSAFGRGEADVLVGTQLVAKGLDFPNVTVVGVINADTELAFPSYRSHERMFQLLSQVAGRSGRSQKAGRVFLQTRQSDHFTLKHAREHDYEGFARKELAHRKPLLYPPYSRLMYFSFKGKQVRAVEQVARVFTRCLENLRSGFPVLGPSPDIILKVKNEYRWLTIMKLPADAKTSMAEGIPQKVFELYNGQKPEAAGSVKITVSHEML